MSFLRRYQDDPSAPRLLGALRDLVLRVLVPGVVLWALVVGFGWLLVHGPLRGLSRAEEGVNRTLADARTDRWNSITHLMTLPGDTPKVEVLAAVVAVVVLVVTRKWWVAVVPLIAIALQATVFVVATHVTGRHRPLVPHLDHGPETSSYPSGHVGAAAAIYATVVLLGLRITRPVLRWPVVVVAVVVPLLVAFSRVYRGMHHVTDVGVGLLVGAAAALLAWGWLRRAG
jgi:undecaprenyl-diphosphatase